jgi:hypothetical protein
LKYSAISQAHERLNRAQDALQAMERANNFYDVQQAWTDFLTAANTIYSKLQEGAKGCGKSEPWFGRQLHARRSDPLLRYIHFARNADEHGIAPITAVHLGSVSVAPEALQRGGTLKFIRTVGTEIGEDGKPRPMVKFTVENNLGPASGPKPKVYIQQPHVRLISVHDSRFGVSCDPPQEHLGEPLPDQSPQTVANLALIALSRMITEAYELPRDEQITSPWTD